MLTMNHAHVEHPRVLIAGRTRGSGGSAPSEGTESPLRVWGEDPEAAWDINAFSVMCRAFS